MAFSSQYILCRFLGDRDLRCLSIRVNILFHGAHLFQFKVSQKFTLCSGSSLHTMRPAVRRGLIWHVEHRWPWRSGRFLGLQLSFRSEQSYCILLVSQDTLKKLDKSSSLAFNKGRTRGLETQKEFHKHRIPALWTICLQPQFVTILLSSVTHHISQTLTQVNQGYRFAIPWNICWDKSCSSIFTVFFLIIYPAECFPSKIHWRKRPFSSTLKTRFESF